MSAYFTEEDMDRLPPGLRMKISQLGPDRIASIKDRVRRRALRMTAKKMRKIERAKQSKARSIMRKTPPTEIYDRRATVQNWPRSMDVPPRVIRFTPKESGELVDIPLNLKEGVQRELVERYGIPTGQAGVIASNAIDNWIKVSPPPKPTTTAKAMVMQRMYEPTFLVHPFSPVEYPEGEFTSTFGQYPIVPKPIAYKPVTTEEPVSVEEPAIAKAKIEAREKGYGWVLPVAIGAGLIILAVR